MQPIARALIWDMDGVLVDSGEYHFVAWRETLKAIMQSDISYADFQRTFGLRNVEMLRDYLGFNLTLAEVDYLSGIKESRYREIISQRGMSLLPGVKEWLSEARSQGWLQAVASSAPRENVEAVVDTVGIRDFFQVMLSAEDVKHGKPDPEVFLTAASRLGVPPSNCLIIEDAPVGIQGAKSAGIRCVGVLTTHAHLDADIVINRLSDLAFTNLSVRFGQ